MSSNPNLFQEKLDLIRSDQTGERLNLDKFMLTDADVVLLVDALKTNTKIMSVNLSDNQIGDAGAATLANMLTVNHRLHMLQLEDNKIGPDGATALEEAIIGKNNTTLIHVSGISPAINEHCSGNSGRVDQLLEKLKKHKHNAPELQDDWQDIVKLLPVLRYLGDDIPHKIAGFESFMETLPTVDVSQNTVLEALTVKQGDHAAMDNPLTWHRLDETVARMNANGLYLKAEDLLEADGATPSPILKRAMDSGRVPEIFTAGNWVGLPKRELQTVLDALPEPVQQTIPNRQQLLLAVEREERAAKAEPSR